MIEILISSISGIISGMGMGGGTILIFFLSNIMKIEQHTAQATNLIFFIPTSIIAIIINLRSKNINFKIAVIISIFGIIGSIIGSKIATNIDVFMLRKCFGIFLAIIAINEIYSIVKEYIKKNTKNKKANNKIR